ncbi:hypothetical protein [Tanticharoenia sakaeratensis]|nr:hypothetical protein [Tanticharoenia sakaeratensis]
MLPTRRHMMLLGTLALSCAPVGAAFADPSSQHPPLAPTRDVTVDYTVQPQGSPTPIPVKVAFSGDGNLLRIDGNGGKSITILDRQNQLVTLVSTMQKIYMQFSPRSGLRNPFLLSMSMHYTPAGTATVAGLACNKWAISTDHGSAQACVTDDGVILSESGVDADGAQGQLTAQTVQYGPVPSSQFQPPSGYEQIKPHSGGAGAGAPGAGNGPVTGAAPGAVPPQ